MVSTGIAKLDDYLGGGIPKGKTLLYYNHPGVEGDVFLMQALYHNLLAGKKGIYLTSSSDPNMVREQFADFGWNLDSIKHASEDTQGEEEPGEPLIIIDAYSSFIGAMSEEKYTVENPEDIHSIDRAVRETLEDVGEPVLMCCSLSTLMDMCGVDETLETVEEWNNIAAQQGHNIFYHFTAWPYPEEVMEKIKNELFNAVIEIGGISERVIFGQYFAVMKTDWAEATNKAVLFKTLRPGGIRLYIPKILVTGPFDAGKSTFIHALSTKSVSVDRLGTTIALDHGHVDYKGFSADIFGTPGQERFDPIIRMLSGEAMGIFLVVDSTRPTDFIRAKKMLELTKSQGLPYIIIANKQDKKDALPIEEIRKRFNLPEDVPIVPTVAKDKKGVFEAFELLVDRIMGDT